MTETRILRARRLLLGALATLVVYAAHHAYGASRYATPWRHHAAFVALVLGGVLAVAYASYRRDPLARSGRVAGWILRTLVLLFVVLLVGTFEGVYNHLLKDVLYFAGTTPTLLLRLFPPPTYEMPNDTWFEVSGVLQIVPAAFAGYAWLRFGRDRRATIEHGAKLPARTLVTVSGGPARIPDEHQLVHLQFRRFAGCPVCNLHLRSFARRHRDIVTAGVREVVVFHSPAAELRTHVTELPFDVVADPDKRLYREFGVESSPRGILDPRAWATIARAVVRSFVAILAGRERPPAARPHGGRFGLPADFLVAQDGRVLASKYGEHVDDQWSVDELLTLVRDR